MFMKYLLQQLSCWSMVLPQKHTSKDLRRRPFKVGVWMSQLLKGQDVLFVWTECPPGGGGVEHAGAGWRRTYSHSPGLPLTDSVAPWWQYPWLHRRYRFPHNYKYLRWGHLDTCTCSDARRKRAGFLKGSWCLLESSFKCLLLFLSLPRLNFSPHRCLFTGTPRPVCCVCGGALHLI